jgi:pimeloyl-ACP methyl ester carboxylesterase
VKVVEYGAEHRDVILLLHGGGLSWWNYRTEAELLCTRFHVILPLLDGHAGSDADFTGIADNAKRILSFIDSACGGKVLVLGGLSLGAQVLVEMLSRRKDICRHAIVESASLVPSALTCALIGLSVSASYGLLQYPWFVRAQFKALKMRGDLFGDYARDSCAISKDNMVSFLKANTSYRPGAGIRNVEAAVRVVVGGNEQRRMRLSAEVLHGLVPGSRLEVKEGLHHGEYSINRPEDYVRELLEMIG